MCRYVFSHGISKADANRITKLDVEMLQDSHGNPFNWGSKGQRSKDNATSHKNFAVVGLCTPVSAGF